MTDPSPDCGYTDAEARVETVRDAIYRAPAYTHASALASLDALAAALAEQTQRTDQAFEEIARLREFGEHYSGAAQDAWDRIVVLEKALAEAETLVSAEKLHAAKAFRSALLYAGCGDDAVCVAEQFVDAYALAAGSASPGGAET